MDGFFHTSTLAEQKAPLPLIPRCGACGLHKTCGDGGHPKMPVDGRGERGVLIVGEAPGATENEQGKPFVGKAGKYLRKALEKIDVDLERDCWITNALVCWPWEKNAKGQQKNRAPTDKEIDYCRPNLVKTIQDLNPQIIIPLGGPAVSSLIGWLWKENVGLISRWTGWNIPCQKLNAWVCPNNHPSYCMRMENPIIDRFFEKHLETAFAHRDRPWKKLPNYAERVQVEMVPRQAAHLVREIIRMRRPVAFDYETESGINPKPDRKDTSIVCCAVSNGVITVAYPWFGEAITATMDLVRSPLPKIAANLDFEHRWTLTKNKKEVRKWGFDTMLAAHILDNRKGVCSLKFQAFVLLGQESWDDAIKKSFRDFKPNGLNSIRDIEPRQLLCYCGLDALLEWEIAKIQSRQLGIDLCAGLREQDDANLGQVQRTENSDRR